ncbi:MAG: polysaccharide pyruvyl transferase family protein [Lentisphaerae bacterium]|nr:polysaccharide pyruvyl transferase family protein [Lentisphaerota bacterium]
MAKIGIITIFKSDNYGAELQAFALQKNLELMGFDSELIDYPFYKHPSHQHTRGSAPLFPIGTANRLKEWTYPYWQYVKSLPRRQDVFTRRTRMDAFHRAYTRLSLRTYHTIEQLNAADHPYDVFMVGSDQVWNPRMNSSLDPYFLTFAPEGRRRVSYASSFGVSKLPEVVKRVYSQRLSVFDALSAREKQGVAILRELVGRDAAHVLDPTLLLGASDWDRVAVSPTVDAPYVLLYELMPCAAAMVVAKNVAREITGARVIRICGDGGQVPTRGITDVADAGPSEFVGLFLHAAAVVTNSFHGTAFAVNFQKPVFPVIPKKMTNSNRISGLLEMTGLTGRSISAGQEPPQELTLTFDASAVVARLDAARERSLTYLAAAVAG